MATHSTSYSSYSSSAKTSGGGALSGSYNYDTTKSLESSKEGVSVKNTDMTDELRKEAIKVTEAAFEQFTVEKDIAAHIKKAFDQAHGAAWHCIVGKNYGSYVTHETNHFIYLEHKKRGNLAVLLFKSG